MARSVPHYRRSAEICQEKGAEAAAMSRKVLEKSRHFPLAEKKENLETVVVSRFSLVEISGIEPLTS